MSENTGSRGLAIAALLALSVFASYMICELLLGLLTFSFGLAPEFVWEPRCIVVVSAVTVPFLFFMVEKVAKASSRKMGACLAVLLVVALSAGGATNVMQGFDKFPARSYLNP